MRVVCFIAHDGENKRSQQKGTTMTQETEGAATQPSATSHAVRRRENTRLRLLEAAEKVFVDKGFGATRVDDLVNEAGFTRGAFYSNFDSIEQVFFDMFERMCQERIDVSLAVLDEFPDNVDPRIAITEAFDRLEVLSDNWYLILQELHLMSVRVPGARDRLNYHRDVFGPQAQVIISGFLTKFGRTANVPLSQLTEAVVALYLNTIVMRLMHGINYEGIQASRAMIGEIAIRFSDPIEPNGAQPQVTSPTQA